MLNLLEGQLLNDVVSRVEQSRFSYNSQTEEFRNLNANFQTYLNDIKRIDDENCQLQNNIEQIRTNYIVTLEHHLKRLPEDFQQESHVLTEAHLERYKSKSRAKRFINEREELKKRINFVANNDKEQMKRLNNLQKQDRLVKNELKNFNEQLQNLYNYVEREKQTHRQAMDKVDQLQLQLEQASIARSKTEFEIQNLREEVKLMQTAKEFLDDEYETILSTQTEANEYFLSCLNESVLRIREDFDDLNKRQVKQVENEYKQMMQILEDNSLTKATLNDTATNHHHTIHSECEKLQDEHQSMAQELTTLNDHNQILSERILAMEADLYAIHDERTQDLFTKDNELEQSRIELQSLNEKLNHLTEYDQNLKFELTLYRGVLESEYRRKQQQSNNNHPPVRPTILRTIITRNNKNSTVSTNRVQFDLNGEKANTQFNEILSTTNYLEDEKVKNNEESDHQESLSQEWKKSFNGNDEEKIQSISATAQDEQQTSEAVPKSSVSTDSPDQISSPKVESPSQATVTSSAPPLLDGRQPPLETSTVFEDQPESIDVDRSPTTTSDIETFTSSLPANEEISPPGSSIFSLATYLSSLISSEGQQKSIDFEKLSSIPATTDLETLSDVQESSKVLESLPLESEDQNESLEFNQVLTTSQDNVQQTPINSPTSLIDTVIPTDRAISSEDDKQSSSSQPEEEQLESSEIHQSLDELQDQAQQPFTMSPTNEQISSDTQKSTSSSSDITAPTDLPNAFEADSPQVEEQQETRKTPQSPSPALEDQQTFSEHQRSLSTSQEEVEQLPAVPSMNEQKSPTSPTNTASPTDLPISFEDNQSLPTQLENHHELSEIQQPRLSQSEEQLGSSDYDQSNEQISSETQKFSTSPDNTPSSTNISTEFEDYQTSALQPENTEESSEPPQLITTTQDNVQETFTITPVDQQTSPTSSPNTTPSTDLSTSFKINQIPTEDDGKVSDIQQSSGPSYNEQSISTELPSTQSQEDRFNPSDIQQEQLTSSEPQQAPLMDEHVLEQSSSINADDYRTSSSTGEVVSKNLLAELSGSYDNDDYELEEKTEPLTYKDDENATNQRDKEESSSFDISTTTPEETKQNINSPNNNNNNKSILEEDLTTTEEQTSSSDCNQIEEDNEIGYTSSVGYYGTTNYSTYITNQKSNNRTSSTDVVDDNTNLTREVDQSTSPKVEQKDVDDDNNESTLEAVMQDLRYVYRDLANEDDLVEINDDFPNNLIDRLEFGDNLIRTLFDGFLRKYLVQPANDEIRLKTLDWIEFRDILFPILTGRYMERHIRKLFDLFDTSKDGYLSLQEIIELFELLQVSNATELAEYMMHEFDTNHDGKININEFMDVIKKTEDVNNNILPEKLADKSWFYQQPLDDDNNDISLEVPSIVQYSFKPNGDEIIVLGRIFKRLGADVKNKQLDTSKPILSMKITNEFIHNNIHVSNDDLHSFIDLYINKKQTSDRFINWNEFRDMFLPFFNGGLISKDDISRWFSILDTDHTRTITREQILHLLRLLQISHPNDILHKMNEMSEKYINKNDSWTCEELLFVLENIDETTTHLCSINEQIKSYDLEWFTKNIF